jgi:hypothetical protein
MMQVGLESKKLNSLLYRIKYETYLLIFKLIGVVNKLFCNLRFINKFSILINFRRQGKDLI